LRRVDRLTADVTGHDFNCAIGALGYFPAGEPAISLQAIREPAMTDQELIFSALRQVGLIIAEHLESSARDAEEAITQLIAVLDTPELAEAMKRVARGYGLRW